MRRQLTTRKDCCTSGQQSSSLASGVQFPVSWTVIPSGTAGMKTPSQSTGHALKTDCETPQCVSASTSGDQWGCTTHNGCRGMTLLGYTGRIGVPPVPARECRAAAVSTWSGTSRYIRVVQGGGYNNTEDRQVGTQGHISHLRSARVALAWATGCLFSTSQTFT